MHYLGPAERNVTTNIFSQPTDTPVTNASALVGTLAPNVPGTISPAVVTTAPAGNTPSSAGGGSVSPIPAGEYTLQSFLEATLTNDRTITQPGSPQNKAFLQLQTTNPELDPNNAADQDIITQKYALNTLFYSTSIFTAVTWIRQDLWTTAAPVCAPNNSNWFGVECAQPGVVTSLNLTANNLNGTLPSELQGLTALSKYITCFFVGPTIVHCVLIQFPAVFHAASLDITNNSCFMEIPSTLGKMTALRTAIFGSNYFSGVVPLTIQSLSNLVTLDLNRNFFAGPLPIFPTALPLLETLDLMINDFTGSIPMSIGGYTSLRTLRLAATTVISTIPTEIGLLTALEEFTLARSTITGSIPSQIGLLSNLGKWNHIVCSGYSHAFHLQLAFS